MFCPHCHVRIPDDEVAAEFKRITLAKLAAGKKKMRSAGLRCEGVKPYGALPSEGQVLALILAMRQAGNSWNKIATHLNHEKILSRRGLLWRPNVIARIARNALSVAN